jgi:DNA-directed RNA polymerase subunit omega
VLVEPNLDVMLHDKRVGNKFSLVTLAMKRARQLNDGHSPLVLTKAKKPVSIALEEIYQHQVKTLEPVEVVESVQPQPEEPTTASVLAVPSEN